MLLAVVAHATPAHYIVFVLDDERTPHPQYYEAVRLVSDPTRIDAAAPKSGRVREGGDFEVVVRGYAGDELQHVEVVNVPVWLRSEDVDDRGHVHGQRAAAEQRSFVLRVSADVDRLQIDGGRGVHELAPYALAERAEALPLASMQRIRAKAKASSQPRTNRVNLLIMGDGFTEDERGAFDALADQVVGDFFSVSPHREYANMVAVTRLFTASPESGADHPPYRADCTTQDCCADTRAQTDPRAGEFRDTAFDARFCTAQIHRLLTVNTAKAYAAAAAVPSWDRIVMLVNDPVYGGAGGSISVTSAHGAAVMIATHEYGHSFARLTDEYTAPYPGYPACSDRSGHSPCQANATDETDPAKLKWREWLTPGIPVPTPDGTHGVGLFEGARYQTKGMFRPVFVQCLMNTLSATTFCPVCAEAYVQTLYRGASDLPAIQLIEQGSESPGTELPIAYRTGTTQRFSASILRPDTPDVEVRWLLDGVEVGNGDHFDFRTLSTQPTRRTLQLEVVDRSRFLLPQDVDALARFSRSWQIDVTDGGGASPDPAQIGTQFWVSGAGTFAAGLLRAELHSATGTGFGDAFDVEAIQRRRWGAVEIEFTDCDSADLRWQSSGGDSAGFGDGGYRLERVAPTLGSSQCATQGMAAIADHQWIAGTWFGGEARSGEGIFLDVLANGVVVVAFFTHRPAMP